MANCANTRSETCIRTREGKKKKKEKNQHPLELTTEREIKKGLLDIEECLDVSFFLFPMGWADSVLYY